MSEARIDELVQAVRDHSGLSLSEIIEAGEHGADAGWSGFIWTSDGAEFTRAHRELVWSLLGDEAEEMGSPNIAAFVGGFVRSDMAETPEGFDCLLAWWSLETCGRYLADTAEERHEAEAERMRALGEEYGRRASSWLLDGNSSTEAAERLLRGILEGDPETMDALPCSPFSGEYADGLTVSAMLDEADIEAEDIEPEAEDELARSFEDGYSTGAHDGAEAEARAFLGIPDGAAAEVLTCCDCGRSFVAAAGVNYCDGCYVEAGR